MPGKVRPKWNVIIIITIIININIIRKGVTPVEWCKCNQYEIVLKPRRVPVITNMIIITIIINMRMMIMMMMITVVGTAPNPHHRLASQAREPTTPSPRGRNTWTTLLASRLIIKIAIIVTSYMIFDNIVSGILGFL